MDTLNQRIEKTQNKVEGRWCDESSDTLVMLNQLAIMEALQEISNKLDNCS